MTTEILTEKDFKNLLENKLSVLLTQGDWTAKLDAGVKTLKYRNDSGLTLFVHTHTVEVVTSGYIVELNNHTLVNKVAEMYYTIKTEQNRLEQSRKQQVVLETISKLAYNLEKS